MKILFKKTISICASLMLFISVFVGSPLEIVHANTTQANMLLWYKFDSNSGSTITDYSGNNYNGTLIGGATWTSNKNSIAFNGTDGYVKIPNGILKGQNNITISSLVKVNKNITNSWIFGFGSDSNKYILLNSQTKDTGGSLRGGITTGSWQDEQWVQNAAVLPLDVWTNVTLVISGDTNTETLYVDGMQVGQNTEVTIKPSDVYDVTKDYSGYIGKSLYGGDPFFSGEVADFRVYNKALSTEEVKSIQRDLNLTRTSFTPDNIMLDTDYNPIDAHGAGITYDSNTKKYYWYGEYHEGTWPSAGVSVYSSTDLYNWKNEGVALTEIASKNQFTSDPLISKLYADRSDKDDIWADIRVGRIIERPKVIYNDKTKKYVMWMHVDGDKDSNNNAQDYGKAQAGCAISDSPIGPFVYQRSYRMDQCPEGQTDYQPGNPGMARDMNLFKDDNGSAYLIYSSEENRTIYISKLTDNYLDVTGWHKDGNVDSNGNPLRDTTYRGVYGVDYTRVFPGSQREAPAMFKYNGKYYLLTSGATGWAANENEYTTADSIFGDWSTMQNPFVKTSNSDPDPNKAFNSQAACIIPVDAAKGKFIYVGDDWNGGNFSTNGGAKYVFLPIDFGQGTDMTIKWYNNWDLSILDNAASIAVDSGLPQTYTTGESLSLPQSIKVTTNGSTITTPVTWKLNSNSVTSVTLSSPGLYILQAILPQLNNKTVNCKIYSIPNKVQYFVNCSGYATSDYNFMTSYMQDIIINKSAVDQQYNSKDAVPWGYVGSNIKSAGSSSGDIFSTLRYLDGGNSAKSPAGTDLTYKFTVKNGSYTIYTGFNDIWNNGSRKADLYINGVNKNAITFISNAVYKNDVNVSDGAIDITVRNTASQDPLINWIIICKQ